MDALSTAKAMLTKVAIALGESLLNDIAFVGGCTTGLWVTDEFSRQGIRFTDDVDLIVNVMGKSGWYGLRDQLLAVGFSEYANDISCRMRLGDLKVDFMPDDEQVLGFTNRWYSAALDNSVSIELKPNLTVKVVSPVYLIATKLEAFKGRGNNDPLSSRDVEDILTLFDGRRELNNEIKNSSKDVVGYLAVELENLINHRDFDYVAQSAARNDVGREKLILQNMKEACELGT